MSKSTNMLNRLGNLWARVLGSKLRRRSARPVETLESRVLLATLVSANKLTYQDADGDDVEVAFSKPILTPANVNTIFTFNSGTVNGSNATKQQLLKINLVGAPGAAGTTIITKAVRSAANGGDGFAAIGQIDATGIDISTVTIDGDLGRILAGDATTTTQGLGALTVHSMGQFGTSTGAPELYSLINGKLLSLKAKTDLKDVFLETSGGANGQIGSIAIGGSLIGGSSDSSGRIASSGDIGAANILGDIRGGSGGSSGRITTDRKLASLTIGGSLIGSGDVSGHIRSTLEMGAVKIGRDVVGGNGVSSGTIFAGTTLAGVTIGGSLIGSSGQGSGQVFSNQNMGPVVITGNVQGGSFVTLDVNQATGAVVSGAGISSATIGGSLIGGTGNYNGLLASGLTTSANMGAVKITGDLRGGSGVASGQIQANAGLVSVTIGGSIIGGGSSSGVVYSLTNMGAVSVKGDLVGGTGAFSGTIISDSALASVTIGGSMIGGSGSDSGSVLSESSMGPVKVTGNVQGGSSTQSGTIKSKSDSILSTTIGGSLIGGGADFAGAVVSDGIGLPSTVTVTGSIVGGTGVGTGFLYSAGSLTSVKIGGSLIGSSGQSSGHIAANHQIGTVVIGGDVRGGSFDAPTFRGATGTILANEGLGSVTIGGSLIGGTGDFSGYLRTGIDTTSNMGAIKITGNVQGGSGFSSGRIHSTRGLASLTIGGSMIGAEGNGSGSVFSSSSIGPVIITGSLIGGSSGSTGQIVTLASLTSATIGGSVIGGTESDSGGIQVSGQLTTLTVNGDIRGGNAVGIDVENAGSVLADRIVTLTLGGSLIAGTTDFFGSIRNGGAIRVANDIGVATIKGSILGNDTNRALITARGQLTPTGTADIAINKLTVQGRVENALIHAGVNANDSPTGRNADAQIGIVSIGGDWIGSSLVAGALAGVDGQFGTSDDVIISGGGAKDVATVFSKITSVTIGGQALGSLSGGDHFGFVAQNIGSFKVKAGTTTFPLLAGNSNDDFLVGLLGDLRVNEI